MPIRLQKERRHPKMNARRNTFPVPAAYVHTVAPQRCRVILSCCEGTKNLRNNQINDDENCDVFANRTIIPKKRTGNLTVSSHNMRSSRINPKTINTKKTTVSNVLAI